MAGTKWRKAFAALEAVVAGLIQMTAKFIDVDETHVMIFPPGLEDRPWPYMDTNEFVPQNYGL